MGTLKTFDNGRKIDWGKTSTDYSRYRPGPPASLYEKLLSFGVGLPNQKVLDQGTGTGVFARQMARQGCQVAATDISKEQIYMATELAKQENLKIDFRVAAAEKQPFENQSFDLITASQCFMYFDLKEWIPEADRLLNNNGKALTTFFAWIPLEDPISYLSEQLVLKHNPDWQAHSWDGKVPQAQAWPSSIFKQTALMIYDEPISFTREAWRGRWRALRGIGATLSPEEVLAFDQEHDQLLQEKFPETFIVPHRVIARIFERT